MARTESETLTLDGHEVTISNPGKIFFADAGITKIDLVGHHLASPRRLLGSGSLPMASMSLLQCHGVRLPVLSVVFAVCYCFKFLSFRWSDCCIRLWSTCRRARARSAIVHSLTSVLKVLHPLITPTSCRNRSHSLSCRRADARSRSAPSARTLIIQFSDMATPHLRVCRIASSNATFHLAIVLSHSRRELPVALRVMFSDRARSPPSASGEYQCHSSITTTTNTGCSDCVYLDLLCDCDVSVLVHTGLRARSVHHSTLGHADECHAELGGTGAAIHAPRIC